MSLAHGSASYIDRLSILVESRKTPRRICVWIRGDIHLLPENIHLAPVVKPPYPPTIFPTYYLLRSISLHIDSLTQIKSVSCSCFLLNVCGNNNNSPFRNEIGWGPRRRSGCRGGVYSFLIGATMTCVILWRLYRWYRTGWDGKIERGKERQSLKSNIQYGWVDIWIAFIRGGVQKDICIPRQIECQRRTAVFTSQGAVIHPSIHPSNNLTI